MATYGNFPGVQVETEQGGIQSVNIGVEEKVVLFGPANYDADGNVDGEASVGELVGVNSPSEASKFFGEGSELTEAIGEALLNGASINLLRAVAVPRVTVSDEVQSAQTGTLGGEAEGDINPEIVENTDLITATDGGTELNVQFRYTPGPAEPSANDMVYINPLTGEYALGEAPTDLTFSYEYYDYRSAFFENSVSNYINESETGVLFALSDSNVVSNDLVEIVETFRDNYQLVTGFSFAEPNTQLDLDESEVTPFNGGAEPRYNANNYGTSGNQSVSDNRNRIKTRLTRTRMPRPLTQTRSSHIHRIIPIIIHLVKLILIRTQLSRHNTLNNLLRRLNLITTHRIMLTENLSHNSISRRESILKHTLVLLLIRILIILWMILRQQIIILSIGIVLRIPISN